jgi:VWFA-related protein
LNLSLLLSCCAFAQNPSQDQPIRVRTDLIEIRAVVTDKKGNPIPDLKKEDFELFENNKPQELSFFSVVRIPGRNEATGISVAPPETRPKTDAGRRVETPLQTVILSVDTLHLSLQSLLRIKQELRKFIDQNLTDQDLTAIVSSAGSLGAVEQFTRDRRALRYAVDRLSARPNARPTLFTPYLSSMIDRNDREALQVGISIYSQEENIAPNDPMIASMVQARARQTLSEATYLRRASLITLREVVDRVADLPGQRLVVLVSDGFSLMDQGGSMDSGDLQSVTSRAVRAGVVIYSIDAKGLAPSTLLDASRGNIPNDPRISGYVSAGERDLENGLNALARDTGGQAFFNTNDTAGSLGKALSENELYYAIAYYPAGEESEKKFRKIAIRIKNHPDYAIRAQRGYLPIDLAKKAVETEAKTPQQRFVNAILAPLPRTELGVSAVANYIELPSDKAQVTLTVMIDGNSLKYQEANGRYQFETEVVTFVFNSDGK